MRHRSELVRAYTTRKATNPTLDAVIVGLPVLFFLLDTQGLGYIHVSDIGSVSLAGD
jgi:hypothetical protein